MSLAASMRRSTSDGVRCSRVRSSRFGGRPSLAVLRDCALFRFRTDEIKGRNHREILRAGSMFVRILTKKRTVCQAPFTVAAPERRLRLATAQQGTAEPPSRQRAGISNGTRLLEGLDGRRREARRFAEDPARQREDAAAALLSRTLRFEPKRPIRSLKTIVRLA